jgi:hypothetical protein
MHEEQFHKANVPAPCKKACWDDEELLLLARENVLSTWLERKYCLTPSPLITEHERCMVHFLWESYHIAGENRNLDKVKVN